MIGIVEKKHSRNNIDFLDKPISNHRENEFFMYIERVVNRMSQKRLSAKENLKNQDFLFHVAGYYS